MNITSFSMAGDKLDRKFSQAIATIAFDLDRRVVNRTPVDTGRARANWILSAGTPDTRQLPAPPAPGEVAAATAKQAASVLSSGRAMDTIFLQNNLPYIQKLNDGWSLQAQPGYVQAEIQSVAEHPGYIQAEIQSVVERYK